MSGLDRSVGGIEVLLSFLLGTRQFGLLCILFWLGQPKKI